MNSTVRFRLILVFTFLLVILFVAVSFLTRPVHCVSGVASLGTESIQQEQVASQTMVGYKCFDNQAEAINYATGGRTNLPSTVSREEIDAALRALDLENQQ
jgi:hypothetical protein